jgi:undecaprenyl-diphosphatase
MRGSVDLRIDLLVEQALRKKPHQSLVRAARGFTELGGGPFITAVTTSWASALLLHRRWRDAFRVTATIGLGSLARYLLHLIVARPRPSAPHIHVHGTAFPSGHTTAAALLFGTAAAEIHRPWAWAAAAVAVSSVGASRVILRAHWLTDVIAGIAFAGGWMTAIRTLTR